MAKQKKSEREYILKPGKHQFAPGSHAQHNNENTTDAELAWYLTKFPHIASQFSKLPKKVKQVG